MELVPYQEEETQNSLSLMQDTMRPSSCLQSSKGLWPESDHTALIFDFQAPKPRKIHSYTRVTQSMLLISYYGSLS